MAGITTIIYFQSYFGMSMVTKQEIAQKDFQIQSLKTTSATLIRDKLALQTQIDDLLQAKKNLEGDIAQYSEMKSNNDKLNIELSVRQKEIQSLHEELIRTQTALNTVTKKLARLKSSDDAPSQSYSKEDVADAKRLMDNYLFFYKDVTADDCKDLYYEKAVKRCSGAKTLLDALELSALRLEPHNKYIEFVNQQRFKITPR